MLLGYKKVLFLEFWDIYKWLPLMVKEEGGDLIMTF